MANFLQRIFARKQEPPKPKPLRSIQLFPAWLENTAQWLYENNENFITEGYELNAVIFAAVLYKARAAAGVPLSAYTGTRDDKEKLPTDAPLARFCDRPNPFMSFGELQMLSEVYYNLFGNSYTVFLRKPNEITAYTLRPDYVTHLYKDDTLLGYWYRPLGCQMTDGVPILASDMMHVKIPNPGDRYAGMGKGLSPLYPLARSADVDNAATNFLKIFFDRGAMPLGLITSEQQIDENTAQGLKDRWLATYGEYHNWIEPLVFGAGATYQKIGASFSELDMTTLDRRNEARMVMPFGVPLTLIESAPQIVQSTYSNKETDRRMFWEDTMLPELHQFEVEWRYYLQDDAGAFVTYDYGDIPALLSVRMERAEALGRGWDRSAVTQNEYRAALGLDPLPNGDRIKLSVGVQLLPVAETPQPTTEAGAAASSDEDEAPKSARPVITKQIKALSLERKEQLYRAFDSKAVDSEPALQEAARDAFRADERAVMAEVGAAQSKAYQRKATVAWGETLLSVTDYLSTAGEEQWRAKFAPVLEVVVQERQQQLAQEFGMEFDVRPLQAEEWFQEYLLKFSQEISDTSQEQIKAIFAQALAEGWTVPEMEKQLKILFQQWIDGNASDSGFALERLPQRRLELIARDQSVRAANAGAMELYREWAVPKKEWFSTADARTRDKHRVGAAWGQAPLVVPVDEPFSVGGDVLMYPGDPGGSPENVIQCRCTSLPVFPD